MNTIPSSKTLPPNSVSTSFPGSNIVKAQHGFPNAGPTSPVPNPEGEAAMADVNAEKEAIIANLVNTGAIANPALAQGMPIDELRLLHAEIVSAQGGPNVVGAPVDPGTVSAAPAASVVPSA